MPGWALEHQDRIVDLSAGQTGNVSDVVLDEVKRRHDVVPSTRMSSALEIKLGRHGRLTASSLTATTHPIRQKYVVPITWVVIQNYGAFSAL